MKIKLHQSSERSVRLHIRNVYSTGLWSRRLKMFIQVPESVNKSLRNGISPRTEIHFPNSSLGNRHPRAILADDDRLRNEMFARRECDCGADGVTMPVYGSHWIPWRPPMFPSHESYRRSREVCNNLLLTPRSSPSKQSVTGVTESAKTAQKAVAREEVETPTKENDHSEEDEIESLGSPRSFASSESTSSRDDMLNQFPEIQSPAGGHTPAPKSRSQQPNPWGRASYSDLITMAITLILWCSQPVLLEHVGSLVTMMEECTWVTGPTEKYWFSNKLILALIMLIDVILLSWLISQSKYPSHVYQIHVGVDVYK